MKKKKNAFYLIIGLITILFFSSLSVSCLTDDTWYRIGYDIGSQLNYEDDLSNAKKLNNK
ncbi:MAG: hypothetical protein FWD13_12005 [Treponema sp.]|nr:hypothetical protein [Treponema sp.]